MEIPKGYKWCSDCNALTPHRGGKWGTDECIICGNIIHNVGMECPNCGWEDDSDSPFEQEIILHYEGCHLGALNDEDNFMGTISDKVLSGFRKQFLGKYERSTWILPRGEIPYREYQRRLDLFRQAKEMKCGCPRYIVYNQPWIISSWSSPYYSMDCINAVAFGAKIRCPICGEIFEWEDTNC